VNGSHWWFASGGERCGVSTGASGSRHITGGGGCEPGMGYVRQRFRYSVRGDGQSRMGDGELVLIGEGRGHGAAAAGTRPIPLLRPLHRAVAASQ